MQPYWIIKVEDEVIGVELTEKQAEKVAAGHEGAVVEIREFVRS